jgi:DNA-binding transcriptional LysR family regulator
MDSDDLKVFEAVARLGRMSLAADELHTVQSNVSTRIRLLEARLGTALFARHSRGVTLTEAGARLLPYAAQVVRLVDEARRAARDDGRPGGPLTIGTLETTMATRLAPILAAYAAAHPGVDLTLRTGSTGELIEAVLERRLDGAYVTGPVAHRDLEYERVLEEELVVVTAASVRSLEALLGDGDVRIVVMRAGCSYRKILEAILSRRGVVGLRHLEFGTWESILGCVAAGLGVTLLPAGMIGPAWRDGRLALHHLPGREGRVETVFIRRRDAHLSSALSAFLDMARPTIVPMQAAE